MSQSHQENVSCFWGLLALPNYEIAYLPSKILSTTVYRRPMKDLIFGRSLLDFVHPDERQLAKSDFDKFAQCNGLGGAITRCRLRKLDCLSNYEVHDYGTDLDWITVDVVTYSATENLLLAFFHCDQGFPVLPHVLCDYDKENEIANDLPQLHAVFNHFQYNKVSTQVTNVSIGTLRTFQLYDQVTQNLVLSYPTKDALPLIPDEMWSACHHDYSRPPDAHPIHFSECAHHHRQSFTIPSAHQSGYLHMEKIIIYYGNFIFAVFQVTPSPIFPALYLTPAPIQKDVARLPSPPSLCSSPTTPPAPSPPSDHSPKQRHKYKPRGPAVATSKSWRIRPTEKKKCESCHTSQSPEWRRGPSGHRTLCNACGLRYSRSLSKKDQRPPLSPVFAHTSAQERSSFERPQPSTSFTPLTQPPLGFPHH
ncbi:hypothetical protein DM01DRAFT_1303547 [Hesseltinella vesiculosa]|uniref:GATA-type domain-containing protein n=1 Tax=Hesseltinella vesiculosa TaxID=101127 RepID=A0A1X2GKM5_9FUNG|nr:hypothetical protein DM01DRAFT_1303547 [Hesseltinella vesiculosa]